MYCRYLWFATYFGGLWGLHPLPSKCLQLATHFCSCIPAGQFCVYVCKGKYFTFLTHALGVFSLVMDFPILLLDAACSCCCILFLTPSRYLSATRASLHFLSAVGTTLHAGDHNGHVMLAETRRLMKTIPWYPGNVQAWEGTSGLLNHAVMREGVISGVPTSSMWLSSFFHPRHRLQPLPRRTMQFLVLLKFWAHCKRIWALINQKIRLGNSRGLFIINSACRKGRYVCGLERGQHEASPTSAQFN